MRVRIASIAARLGALAAVLTLGAGTASAAETSVAVAANFADAAREIGDLFRRASGHQAVYSFGATGLLYAQIAQAAPFEVFLAADGEHPKRAEAEGLAVPGSRFTYATGRLVLFSRYENLVRGEATLKEAKFAKLAIANPATAPYGIAAIETLKALGVYAMLKPGLVQGNSIAQAYQFVGTGNAELGFVALSQVVGHARGSRWLVPEDLHAAIAQDAVLLRRGEGNPAARAFLAFLKGAEADAVKAKYGYGVGDE